MSTEVSRAEVGGVRFSYQEKGAGPALVLIHGVGSGARSWAAQLESLSSAFRVIAWDAPGYGDSTPQPAASPRPEDYTARLELLLGALGVERLHLVGHSLGAIIAARFAAEHPQRIVRLTLASPSGGHLRLPEAERKKLRDGRLDDLASLGARGMAEKRGPRLVAPDAAEEHRRAVVETMAQIHPAGYAQAVHLLSNSDTRADVARLPATVPLQFVLGDADVITPPASTRDIASVRPGAPVHVIPGAGHALYIENPEAFNRFLAS
jgi:pimeloyl-ACP methyl ester carboxylesterase